MIRYTLRDASAAALIATLEAVQEGKALSLVSYCNGEPVLNGACVVYPCAEMVDGTPYEDTEMGVIVTPQIPTGFWLCEVRLDAPDDDLEALQFVFDRNQVA